MRFACLNYFLCILGVMTPVAHCLAQSTAPNVVLIISDDHGFPDYGFMGHPQVQTPHLDRLAGESLVYTRGYVSTPLCCPSLTTMQTGLFAWQHGYTGNDPVTGWGNRHEWLAHYKSMPICLLPAIRS